MVASDRCVKSARAPVVPLPGVSRRRAASRTVVLGRAAAGSRRAAHAAGRWTARIRQCRRRVFGLTRSRSRNSATPSSGDCSSSACTSAPTRRLVDGDEAVPDEELGLEGQAEQPAHAELAGVLDQPVAAARRRRPWPCASGATASVRTSARSSQSTCSAPQPTTRSPSTRDEELLHVLVEVDRRLGQQPAVGGVGVDERADAGDVGGARAGAPRRAAAARRRSRLRRQHPVADDAALDLAGALEDRGEPGVAPVALDPPLGRVAVAAVQLHRLAGDPHGHLGGEQLDRRGLLLGRLALVEQVRDLLPEGARLRDLGGHVGEREAQRLEVADRVAELLALLQVERAVLDRGPRHARRRARRCAPARC